jgi:hypothetical protein
MTNHLNLHIRCAMLPLGATLGVQAAVFKTAAELREGVARASSNVTKLFYNSLQFSK